MEFFWASPDKRSFKEILEYFNNVKKKNWKKQTLSTFLTILQRDGHVLADMSGKKYLYYPARSRDEHITNWVQNLCKECFDDSLGKFVAAFTGGKKLTQRDSEELKTYLNTFEDKE